MVVCLCLLSAVQVAESMQQEVTAKRGELDALQNRFVYFDCAVSRSGSSVKCRTLEKIVKVSQKQLCCERCLILDRHYMEIYRRVFHKP